MGQHSLKAGARFAGSTSLSSRRRTSAAHSPSSVAAWASARQQRPAAGDTETVTSIERFRRTQVFLAQGLTAAQIRALGGGASQFRLSSGNPETKVSQWDFGGFFQDDWKLRPNLTVSLGLRYENQKNIDSNFNFASTSRLCLVAGWPAVEDCHSRRLRRFLRAYQREPDDAGDALERRQSAAVHRAESGFLPAHSDGGAA